MFEAQDKNVISNEVSKYSNEILEYSGQTPLKEMPVDFVFCLRCNDTGFIKDKLCSNCALLHNYCAKDVDSTTKLYKKLHNPKPLELTKWEVIKLLLVWFLMLATAYGVIYTVLAITKDPFYK